MASELCQTDDPLQLPNGQLNPTTRCRKTHKRIRVTDGYCNGCVPWGKPESADRGVEGMMLHRHPFREMGSESGSPGCSCVACRLTRRNSEEVANAPR